MFLKILLANLKTDILSPTGKSYLLYVGSFFCLVMFAFSLNGQTLDLFKAKEQPAIPELNAIELFVEFIPGTIGINDLVALKLWGRVDERYHIYSVVSQGQFAPEPTQLILTSDILSVDSELIESPPVWVEDEAFGERLKVHKHDFWLERKYKLKNNIPPGSYKINGGLFFQICNVKICSLPLTKPFTVQLNVSESK